MKTMVKTIFLFLVSQISHAQGVMDIALKNKPLLIEESAFEIKEIMSSLNVTFVNEEFHIIDKPLLDDLKLQSEKEQKSSWKKSDFKNRILIRQNEKISLDSIKEVANSLNKEQKKLLTEQIKSYNANEVLYRGFPIKISKPVYSSDRRFAVVGFSKGNNGGEIVLYKLVGEKWREENVLKRWAY
ncbi:MAG: hypothetical protein EOO50_10115 [Flavobacterium sp.]|uniref:hypothetical protein n=1 Tax=Flavobacterium sp. TaxID=239 RepID=UPI00122962BB|nr:hypothetical protein [Flavobacterium sp.]RZJ66277.1 MAG: hypothetical protein EOO50_10115 [Flavobacterium sp.]